MAIGTQVAGQIQAQMLGQIPDAFKPFFNMQASGTGQGRNNGEAYYRAHLFCCTNQRPPGQQGRVLQ